jgi:5-methylcytosine-specific restriction endonuclease McrA
MPLTRLADLVASEAGVSAGQVAFIRHSTESIRMLAKFGATIEEYTAVQPVGSKYDFAHPDKPPVSVVVVVIQDSVYAAFRLLGVDSTGPSTEISTPEYIRFDQARGKASRYCHKFQLTTLHTRFAGFRVVGWEGRARTPVQRADDSFFAEVMVDAPDISPLQEAKSVEDAFVERVQNSLRSPAADRQRRLAQSDGVVERIAVLAYAYSRNPDVVAEVLLRANGFCERCRRPAPFRRKSDQRPYLEVHHTLPLSAGGLDIVANAEAICPNCHREAHYGDA